MLPEVIDTRFIPSAKYLGRSAGDPDGTEPTIGAGTAQKGAFSSRKHLNSVIFAWHGGLINELELSDIKTDR